MSITRTVGTLAHEAVSGAVSAARHPISTASWAAGMVKGTAGVGVGLVRGVVRATGHAGSPAEAPTQAAREAAPEVPAQREDVSSGPAEPEVVPKPVPTADELPEPIVIEADDEPGEAFHTEPKAASRASAHGGPAGDREEVDGYVEEIPDESEDAPVWTSESGAALAEEGLDDAVAKAVLSEAETLRKAADPHKG